MASYTYRDGISLTPEELAHRVAPVAQKISWFISKGYSPHLYQTLFHTDRYEDKLTRYRCLAAGRRGGKTLSAAWEVLFYALFPQQFHWDSHGETKDDPLWIWVLTKDYKIGLPALLTFRKVLKQAGLVHGVDYKEHRGEKYFEFENGSFIQFKTADDPESLRGAGLDILWMDETALIPSDQAWNVVSPALADKSGMMISTTTPQGKNWFYDEFWGPEALIDPEVTRIEYRSIDNPYFPREQWERYLKRYHPLLFKQEFMASFEATAGRALSVDWLNYYTQDELPKDLQKFIGVDPAISLSDTADRFVISLIGIPRDFSQVYLLEQWAGRIPFAEQLDIISQWHLLHRPQMIGVEAVAYQSALVQQALRLPGLPPIIPMQAKGKKSERILSMSPLFRAGRIKISREHKDFINEWLDYDPEIKNPKDDCLDSVEIALRTAGAVLPTLGPSTIDEMDRPPKDISELAWRLAPTGNEKREKYNVDESLGAEW